MDAPCWCGEHSHSQGTNTQQGSWNANLESPERPVKTVGSNDNHQAAHDHGYIEDSRGGLHDDAVGRVGASQMADVTGSGAVIGSSGHEGLGGDDAHQ